MNITEGSVRCMKQSNSFFAMMARMKYINRWALMRNSAEENISEHSMEVAMLAHGLALIGNRRLGRQYDAEHIAMLGLFHDCTEIITGDMPTPIKYENEQIQRAYKQIEASAAYQLLHKLPADLQEDYEPLLLENRHTPQERRLVKAADKLSALIKCLEEEKAGNQEFRCAREATRAAIHGMQCPEAEIFLEEFLPAYSSTLDEL